MISFTEGHPRAALAGRRLVRLLPEWSAGELANTILMPHKPTCGTIPGRVLVDEAGLEKKAARCAMAIAQAQKSRLNYLPKPERNLSRHPPLTGMNLIPPRDSRIGKLSCRKLVWQEM